MNQTTKTAGQIYFFAKALFNAQKKNAKLANGWELEGYRQQLTKALEDAKANRPVKSLEEQTELEFYEEEILLYAGKLNKAVAEKNAEDVSYWNKLLQKAWGGFEDQLFFN